MGFSYDGDKDVYANGTTLKDKIAFNIIKTGGPEIAYGPSGKNGSLGTILYPIDHGIFYFVGMPVKEPFICFSLARLSDEDRENELDRFEDYLKKTNASKS
jgi:NAD(P)H dehydrogenase (quinone)